MKHIARLILSTALCLLCSCAGLAAVGTFFASPAGTAVVSLVDLGLDVAAAKGHIKDGDKIALQKGVAIVTSPGSTLSKVFSIEGLGLSQAVADGYVKQGDAIIVQGVSAIIKTAVTPTTAAKNPVVINP